MWGLGFMVSRVGLGLGVGGHPVRIRGWAALLLSHSFARTHWDGLLLAGRLARALVGGRLGGGRLGGSLARGLGGARTPGRLATRLRDPTSFLRNHKDTFATTSFRFGTGIDLGKGSRAQPALVFR